MFSSFWLYTKGEKNFVQSDVFWGDLKGRIPRKLVRVDDELIPQAFNSSLPRHSLVVIYTLAMDARRLNRPSDIISTYLGYAYSIAEDLDSHFRFSLALDSQRHLDSRNILDVLRPAFENEGMKLPQDVVVSVKEEGREWLITDKDKKRTYAVRKTKDKLINIYDYTDVKLLGDAIKEELEELKNKRRP